MDLAALSSLTHASAASTRPSSTSALESIDPQQEKVRETFQSVVGETFYSQMLKSMRQTVGKPAYCYGGRGEEVFQQQLDQMLAQKMTEASAEQFSGPLWDQFTLQMGRGGR
jgi:Rod binding domain-containing protein